MSNGGEQSLLIKKILANILSSKQRSSFTKGKREKRDWFASAQNPQGQGQEEKKYNMASESWNRTYSQKACKLQTQKYKGIHFNYRT